MIQHISYKSLWGNTDKVHKVCFIFMEALLDRESALTLNEGALLSLLKTFNGEGYSDSASLDDGLKIKSATE